MIEILHLLAINKNIELIVVGEGNFKNRLLKKVKYLNIEDKIKFLGKILKPYDLIAGQIISFYLLDGKAYLIVF